jgi:hypothetical protein
MTGEMGCEQVRDLAPELALDSAEGEERDAALRHPSGCSGCRQLVSELSSVGDELLQLAPAQDPPAGFETRVLGALTEPPRRGRSQPLARRRGPGGPAPRSPGSGRHGVRLPGAAVMGDGDAAALDPEGGPRGPGRDPAMGVTSPSATRCLAEPREPGGDSSLSTSRRCTSFGSWGRMVDRRSPPPSTRVAPGTDLREWVDSPIAGFPIERGWRSTKMRTARHLACSTRRARTVRALYLVAGSAAQNGLRDSGPLGRRMRAQNCVNPMRCHGARRLQLGYSSSRPATPTSGVALASACSSGGVGGTGWVAVVRPRVGSRRVWKLTWSSGEGSG